MKATFAHMGTSVMVFEMLLRDLGHDVIVPPKPTQRTLSLGTQHSPEFACIPFKIVLGSYLEAIERGADLLVSGGGYGPCRAGFYGELHMRILKDLGYNTEMVFFWPPLRKPWIFYQKVKQLKGKTSWHALRHHIKTAWEKLKALDDVEIKAHEVRALEVKKGQTSKALDEGLAYLKLASNIKEIAEAREAALKGLEKVPQKQEKDTLKVGIIGEIYVQLEPFANFDIEKTLGHMGVHAFRSIFLTNYTREDVLSTGAKDVKKLAAPYLPEKVGGHGQNSVGDIIHYAQNGFDGVIQLAPFTCIPEIVAKSIVPKLSKDYDIPVLTIFIDEQTGKAGVETRLEAFVDLLYQKKKAKAYKKIHLGA